MFLRFASQINLIVILCLTFKFLFMELKNYFSLFDDSFKLFEFLSWHLLCDVPSDSILVDKVHSVVDSYSDLLLHLKS